MRKRVRLREKNMAESESKRDTAYWVIRRNRLVTVTKAPSPIWTGKAGQTRTIPNQTKAYNLYAQINVDKLSKFSSTVKIEQIENQRTGSRLEMNEY